MRRGTWQAQLKAQAREAHERALTGAQPWWVTFSEPCGGIFAADGEEAVAVAATLVGMGERVEMLDTSQEGVRWLRLDGLERLAADQSYMGSLMQAVRRSRLHGSYRQAGTDKEYRF